MALIKHQRLVASVVEVLQQVVIDDDHLVVGGLHRIILAVDHPHRYIGQFVKCSLPNGLSDGWADDQGGEMFKGCGCCGQRLADSRLVGQDGPLGVQQELLGLLLVRV